MFSDLPTFQKYSSKEGKLLPLAQNDVTHIVYHQSQYLSNVSEGKWINGWIGKDQTYLNLCLGEAQRLLITINLENSGILNRFPVYY